MDKDISAWWDIRHGEFESWVGFRKALTNMHELSLHGYRAMRWMLLSRRPRHESHASMSVCRFPSSLTFNLLVQELGRKAVDFGAHLVS